MGETEKESYVFVTVETRMQEEFLFLLRKTLITLSIGKSKMLHGQNLI